jgi:parallel beta-helix repeat protein
VIARNTNLICAESSISEKPAITGCYAAWLESQMRFRRENEHDCRRRKHEVKWEKFAAVLLVAATVLGLAASAGAVDGVIEINQAKVLANGGFPYTISNTGSYRLTGNLTVPGTADGIDITAAGVTLDMNGFSITGNTGLGTGINNSDGEATVENGKIVGFSTAVAGGSFAIIRKVHAEENSHYGIQVGDNSVVEGCSSSFNGGPTAIGIACFNGCEISGNIANQNGADGIDCTGIGCVISRNTANLNGKVGINCSGSGCQISGNTADSNGTSGISCGGSGCLISGNAVFSNVTGISASDTSTGYGGNVLKNTLNVFNGASLGHNLCSGVVC